MNKKSILKKETLGTRKRNNANIISNNNNSVTNISRGKYSYNNRI